MAWVAGLGRAVRERHAQSLQRRRLVLGGGRLRQQPHEALLVDLHLAPSPCFEGGKYGLRYRLDAKKCLK